MKKMRLRYAGICRACGANLPARGEALYDADTKTVLCVGNHGVPDAEAGPQEAAESAVEVGDPGASARREFDRRKQRREDRIRAKHPKVGGLILALSEDPQSTKAWATGATGEERLGARLNELANDNLRVLHDRRIPATRANIDHLAVTPTGVWVIDAKKYKGRPELRIEGGLLRARVEKLMVGGRDQTKLVDGVLKQADVVRGLLDEQVPIHAALCFVEADWPLVGGAFQTRAVQVVWPKKLYPKLAEPGPLTAEDVDRIHQRLAQTFPQA